MIAVMQSILSGGDERYSEVSLLSGCKGKRVGLASFTSSLGFVFRPYIRPVATDSRN